MKPITGSRWSIRKRRLRYLKRSKVLTPGNKKPHKKKLDENKIKSFGWEKENFGIKVKFKGGKRKRK